VAATSEIQVPDIGDFKDVPIIEIHVNPGDAVKTDDPLITLESDKATMDVPAPRDGTVDQLLVKVGDKVSEGSPIVRLKGDGAAAGAEAPVTPPPSVIAQQEPAPQPRQQPAPPPAFSPQPQGAGGAAATSFAGVHASPSVRRLARELGIDLTKVRGTGEKGRVTQEDVRNFLKGPAAPAAAAAPSGGMGIPEIPAVDFSKFGPVETKPLVRIKRISGPFLHRAWLNIPHVTHGDEADITEIEEYRKQLDADAKADKKKPYRVSLLPFLMKASVSALKMFPEFNSSLTPEKDALIYKKYYNIGIAVDTPEGLVVPVVKDVDRKGIVELSRELGDTSAKAREGKLAPAEMQGGTFTISSLGGIGGTDFTPIVNAPEVAILGVVRSRMAPVWNGSEFKPRLMLPLYISYDHRVIDGALAARFARHLCTVLEDVRRLVL
jgi:pyruvate dehydrogenase E2 component (dihydrolipoamide acetyltransferase)